MTKSCISSISDNWFRRQNTNYSHLISHLCFSMSVYKYTLVLLLCLSHFLSLSLYVPIWYKRTNLWVISGFFFMPVSLSFSPEVCLVYEWRWGEHINTNEVSICGLINRKSVSISTAMWFGFCVCCCIRAVISCAVLCWCSDSYSIEFGFNVGPNSNVQEKQKSPKDIRVIK